MSRLLNLRPKVIASGGSGRRPNGRLVRGLYSKYSLSDEAAHWMASPGHGAVMHISWADGRAILINGK